MDRTNLVVEQSVQSNSGNYTIVVSYRHLELVGIHDESQSGYQSHLDNHRHAPQTIYAVIS